MTGMSPEAVLSTETRVLEMRVYWGTILLDIVHRRAPKVITIGDTRHAHVFISSEGLPLSEFPLLRTLDGDCVLTFTRSMDGEVEHDGEVAALRDAAHVHRSDDIDDAFQVVLSTHARAIVHWGGITFAFRFVPPAQALPSKWWETVDLSAGNILFTSLLVHLALLVTLMALPRDAQSLREDLFSGPHHALLMEPPRADKRVETVLLHLEQRRESAEAKLAPTKVPGTSKATNRRKIDATLERFRGLLHSSGQLGDFPGTNSLAGSLAHAVGSLHGNPSRGLTSLGTRGGIPGGAPTSRGLADIGTVGRLGNPKYGPGTELGLRKERSIATLSTPLVVGALPRELIQRVINENKAQIRYCYEIELQRDQDLDGKVAVKWIIGATGAVTQVVIAESTLKSSRVGQCLTEKIRSWRFPQPAGGGVVEVNYPFVFKSN